jgi:hypothetical protein
VLIAQLGISPLYNLLKGNQFQTKGKVQILVAVGGRFISAYIACVSIADIKLMMSFLLLEYVKIY